MNWPDKPTADDARGPDPVLARIQDSVASLDTLGEIPLAEHAEVFARVHIQLQAELAEIDGASAG